MKENQFGKNPQQPAHAPLDKNKTVNAPLGGTKQQDSTRQVPKQPTGGTAAGISNLKKPVGGTTGTERPWEKNK